jgi:hypothetical protein
MKPSMTILLTIAMAAMLLPGAGHAQEDAGPTRADTARQFELVRTTPGPSSYTLAVDHRTPDGTMGLDGLLASVLLRTGEDGRIEQAVDGIVVTDDSKRTAGVWVAGQEIGPCAQTGQCHTGRVVLGSRTHFSYSDQGHADAFNRLLIVFEGYELDMSFEGDGWDLHETSLDYRYVEWDDTSTLGVAAGLDGADVFLSAHAVGGQRGSVAIAVPPCSPSHSGVTLGLAKGVGTLALLGGDDGPSLTCPGFGLQALTDFTNEPTTWAAEGPMVGEHTFSSVRLFVLDLPECHSLLPGHPAGATPDGDSCPS